MSSVQPGEHTAVGGASTSRPAEPESTQKDERSDGELRRDIDRARDELAQTLDALEYKLDVSARGREWYDSGRRALSNAWDDRPLVVAGVAAGAVALIAGVAIGAVGMFRRSR